MARAAGLIILLASALFGYYQFVALLLPDYLALLVNIIAVPGILGVLAYVGLRSSPNSVAWLLLTPVLVPLPVTLYLGGDPAKPGLEWLVYYVVVICIALGEIAACFVFWLINRKKDAQHVQA
jgi:hypothetical protein